MLSYCRRCLLLALAIAAKSALAAPGEPARPEVESIATRQSAFSIPFQIDRAAAAGNLPVEVQLHVSSDRGEHWEVYEKVKPEKGSFVFRAPHDGEYWFSIRSLDQAGRLLPAGAPTAGIKVVVDTLAPRLDVTAEFLASGEFNAKWQVVDPELKSDTLKIEYRLADGGPWEELATNHEQNSTGRNTLVGDGTWWLQGANGEITLRVQIADRAGNPAVTQLVVKPGDPAVASDKKTAPSGPLLGASSAIEPARSVASGSANPFERFRDREPAANTTEPVTQQPLPPSREWPAQDIAAKPMQPGGSAVDTHASVANRGTSDHETDWRVANSVDRRAPGFVHSASSTSAQNAMRSVRLNESTDGRTFDYADLAPSERPKMVNSRTFQIDYEVDSVGSAGIAKVELFGTRDGGRSWISLGTDPDNRSPLVVTVDGEGLYGFQVSVQSASGLGGSPPPPGTHPDLWIGVDLTKPSATLTSAEPGNNPDELVIYWNARDRRLERRPIALYFGDEPHGPWTSIAAGLENTSSYTWRMDSRVKERLYLKLEARDEAGNIAEYESAEPVSLNRQLPQGHIRGVRPVTDDSND